MDRKKPLAITIGIFVIFISVFLICMIARKATAFRYEKNLDRAVITVDGSAVSLREFGYYIYIVEAFVQREAMAYDAEDPTKWWNTHFSAGMDSTFVCDHAKETAVDMCVQREIYYREAIRSGITLTETELQQVRLETDRDFEGMSEGQREATGLTKPLMEQCVKKKFFAAKYAKQLAQNTDLSAFDQDPGDLLNWDGEYYQGSILPEHQAEENRKILDNITFGKITVNFE